jgi:hypothetical protein
MLKSFRFSKVWQWVPGLGISLWELCPRRSTLAVHKTLFVMLNRSTLVGFGTLVTNMAYEPKSEAERERRAPRPSGTVCGMDAGQNGL